MQSKRDDDDDELILDQMTLDWLVRRRERERIENLIRDNIAEILSGLSEIVEFIESEHSWT
jgi:hypothetical protein